LNTLNPQLILYRDVLGVVNTNYGTLATTLKDTFIPQVNSSTGALDAETAAINRQITALQKLNEAKKNKKSSGGVLSTDGNLITTYGG
jgi:hypothetical protein